LTAIYLADIFGQLKDGKGVIRMISEVKTRLPRLSEKLEKIARYL